MIIRKRRSVSFISSSDEADDDGVYPIVPLSVWIGYRAMQINQRAIRVLRPKRNKELIEIDEHQLMINLVFD